LYAVESHKHVIDLWSVPLMVMAAVELGHGNGDGQSVCSGRHPMPRHRIRIDGFLASETFEAGEDSAVVVLVALHRRP
jgi:hypothetical protein